MPHQAPTRDQVQAFMLNLQDRICTALEALEPNGATFTKTPWEKAPGDMLQGGGRMAVIKGDTFEKGGVNFSCVHGTFSEQFAREIPGGWNDTTNQPNPFWACGVSLVIHPRNPHCPTVHMNVRRIETGKQWFGGGADLTPCLPVDEDSLHFHNTLKAACDGYSLTAYPEYKKWCDEYFFIKHRNEARGIGGIFYDYLQSANPQNDWAFTQAVGQALIDAYVPIIARRKNQPFTENDRAVQLAKRGRYVEFNLLYDRGTRFGFMTGGNPEAILMSLPPLAAW